MQLERGKNECSDGTYSCDTFACLYNANGRCIYNVALIKQRVSRACYPELLQDEMEARLDYLEGKL